MNEETKYITKKTLQDIGRHLDKANAFDKSIPEFLSTIASFPEASRWLKPAQMRKALIAARPDDGEQLFDELGMRIPYRLRDLCSLAFYLPHLAEALCVIVERRLKP